VAEANDITMNYEQQGTGEPLILIPYLAADNACYAFQVADYANQFTCISIDPRGAGETDKPAGNCSTELLADDVAAFMQAAGVERAHVSGLSLGAATGLGLAAKYPQRVKSLSLHSGWTKTDPFLKTVVEGWQTIAKGRSHDFEHIQIIINPHTGRYICCETLIKAFPDVFLRAPSRSASY
jgi:pimeloyl-ACP methyl ester carboxylesterase